MWRSPRPAGAAQRRRAVHEARSRSRDLPGTACRILRRRAASAAFAVRVVRTHAAGRGARPSRWSGRPAAAREHRTAAGVRPAASAPAPSRTATSGDRGRADAPPYERQWDSLSSNGWHQRERRRVGGVRIRARGTCRISSVKCPSRRLPRDVRPPRRVRPPWIPGASTVRRPGVGTRPGGRGPGGRRRPGHRRPRRPPERPPGRPERRTTWPSTTGQESGAKPPGGRPPGACPAAPAPETHRSERRAGGRPAARPAPAAVGRL